MLSAKLYAQEGSVYLQYYSGGAIMGGERLIGFALDGSSQEVAARFASLQMQGDVLVQTGKLTPPYPDNLSVSYDGGQTWQALGDANYCYGASVEETANGTTYYSNSEMTIRDGYVYVLGVWDMYHQVSDAPLTAVVCRVDLQTGETTPLTGAATGFSLEGSVLTYTAPDGTAHSLTLAD